MTRRAHAYKNKSRALKARFVQELMPAMDAGHIQRSKKDKVPCRVDISNLQCRICVIPWIKDDSYPNKL